jgi:Ferredoxin-dependent bilin reductase
MRFNRLIQDTLTALASLDCQAQPLPDSFARIERAEVDGVLVMETHFMTVADKGELRWVHIYSPKINVLTLFFFPHYRWQLPVYCMELVVFSAQPIVAMLDTVCLTPMSCTTTVEQFMTAAHQAHTELQPATDTPDWFEDCRSGQDFFIRPQNDSDMNTISEIHLALLLPIKTLIAQAPLFTDHDAKTHQRCLQHYKSHHRHHAPGLRLMNRSFGEHWTADYMNTFFQ